MRRLGPRTGALALLGFVLLVPPIDALAVMPANGIPSVALAGYEALERSLRNEAVYVREDAAGRPFIEDQMMAILANVRMLQQGPASVPNAPQRVQDAWATSEGGFMAGEGFYASVVPAPQTVRCVDAQTNAWALWAAFETRAAGISVPDLDLNKRIADLRTLLEGLLQSGRAGTRPACDVVDGRFIVTHGALPLFALLRSRSDTAVNNDGAVRDTLDANLRSYLVGGGFVDDNGFYLATFNSQMLLVLIEAARIYGVPSYAQAREQVGQFIQSNLTQTRGTSTTILQRDRTGGILEGPVGPAEYAWTAAALHGWQQTKVRPDDVVARQLLHTLYLQFWQSARGGFINVDNTLRAEANALPVILTAPLQLRNIVLESATLSVIVPARLEFQYLEQATPGIYIAGSWHAQFGLAAASAGTATALLPPSMVGAFNLTPAVAGLYEPLRLVRSGGASQEMPVALVVKPGRVDLLEFEASVGASTSPFRYRLEAFPPVQPLYARSGVAILVGLFNAAERAVRLATIQFEVDALNVTVTSVTANGEPVTGFSQEQVTTEQLPRPHTRIRVSGVTMAPQAETEFKIEFSDVLPPVIGDLAVTRDQVSGYVPAPTGKPLTLLEGEPLLVRASITDNVVIRSIAARITREGESRDVPVQPQADGTFVANLGNMGSSGRAIVQFTAVDTSGNFNAKSLEIEIKDPIISGSVVLFVFSGTLFLSSLVIWMKVRRKPV